MADELNSQTAAAQTTALPQDSSPAEEKPIESTEQQQTEEQIALSKAEYDRILKEVEDNKAWAHKVSQENAELRQKTVPIVDHSAGKPDPYAEFRPMFADEATFNMFKKMTQTAAKEVMSPVENVLDRITNKTITEEIETDMAREYSDFNQIRPLMEQELAKMPDYVKQRYIGKGYAGYESLYHRAKARVSNPGMVSASGRANMPKPKEQVVLNDEAKRLASNFGDADFMKRVEDNAKRLRAERGAK